ACPARAHRIRCSGWGTAFAGGICRPRRSPKHPGGVVAMSVIDEIFLVFEREGAQQYLGEPVSMTEHMLQSAHAAEQDAAPPHLVAAALLHDYGHLVHGGPEDAAEHGIDTHHEEVAHEFLVEHFGNDIAEPIRMHVAAKRYLCAVEPSYLDQLSEASLLSLQLQGGPFSAEEVAEFESSPHAD